MKSGRPKGSRRAKTRGPRLACVIVRAGTLDKLDPARLVKWQFFRSEGICQPSMLMLTAMRCITFTPARQRCHRLFLMSARASSFYTSTGAGSNGHFAHKMLDMLSGRPQPARLRLSGPRAFERNGKPQSVAAYSDFTYSLWQALGVRPVVIIGHSMGGAIAMDLALRHADMVEGMVLTCTAANFNISDELLGTWQAVMKGRQGQPFTKVSCSPQTPQEIIQEGWMEQIKTDPRVRYFDLLACQQVDLRAQLGQIDRPTLVLGRSG